MFNRRTDVDVTEHVIRPWRIVAFVVASGSLALGIWALARTGLDFDHLFRPERRVLGLPHTPALALGEIAFGIAMVLAAVSPLVGRLLMVVSGAAVTVGGVLVVTDTFERRIDRWTAANDTSGWLFIAVGAVVVLAAAMLPTLASRDRTVTHDDHRDHDRDHDDALFWRHRRDARA